MQSHQIPEFKKEPTYYQILELNEKATVEEIKKAHRMLALKYHPDKNSAPDAAEKFKEAQKAFEILIDPVKKIAYDLYLAMRKVERENSTAPTNTTQTTPTQTSATTPSQYTYSPQHNSLYAAITNNHVADTEYYLKDYFTYINDPFIEVQDCHPIPRIKRPLTIAAHSSYNVTKFLIEKCGAIPFIDDLHAAIQGVASIKNVGIVKLLIEKKPSLITELFTDSSKTSILYFAIAQVNNDQVYVEVVKYLLEFAAAKHIDIVNFRDGHGRTPLHAVAENTKAHCVDNYTEIANLLFEHGAIHLLNNKNRYPEQVVQVNKNIKKVLKDHRESLAAAIAANPPRESTQFGTPANLWKTPLSADAVSPAFKKQRR